MPQQNEGKSSGITFTVFETAKRELERITDYIFVYSKPTANNIPAPVNHLLELTTLEVTRGDSFRYARDQMTWQLKELRTHLDDNKLNNHEKATLVAKIIPDIAAHITNLNNSGFLFTELESRVLPTVLETLNQLQIGYKNLPIITLAPPIPEPPPKIPPSPTIPKEIRQYAFDTMRNIALNNNEHHPVKLKEQCTELMHAYKLLKTIPDKNKTVQDMGRIVTCTNIMGNILQQLKDPRAADIVKMGLDYCNDVLTNSDNRYLNALHTNKGLRQQFFGNPIEIKQLMNAKDYAEENHCGPKPGR